MSENYSPGWGLPGDGRVGELPLHRQRKTLSWRQEAESVSWHCGDLTLNRQIFPKLGSSEIWNTSLNIWVKDPCHRETSDSVSSRSPRTSVLALSPENEDRLKSQHPKGEAEASKGKRGPILSVHPMCLLFVYPSIRAQSERTTLQLRGGPDPWMLWPQPSVSF